MEAEVPEIDYLQDPPDNPINDADEFPFSLFLDEQTKRDILWDWFVECIMTAPAFMAYDTAFGAINRIYMACPFGWFFAGWYTPGTDTLQGTGVTLMRWPYGGISPSISAGLFPEIVDMCTSFANEAAFETYFTNFFKKYYLRPGQIQGYPIPLGASKLTNSDTSTKTYPYTFFNTYCTQIETAARLEGIFDKQKHKKYSTTSKMDAEKLYSMLQEEGTWSEKNWPELRGYNTQYIDNIAIFVPAGFVVAQDIQELVRKDIDIIDPSGKATKILDKTALCRPTTRDSMSAQQDAMFWDINMSLLQSSLGAGAGAAGSTTSNYYSTTHDIYGVPATSVNTKSNLGGQLLGGGLGLLGTLAGVYKSDTQTRIMNTMLVWPRYYAFGRTPEFYVPPNVSEIKYLVDKYNNGYKNAFGKQTPYITLKEPKEEGISDLRKKLSSKGYMPSGSVRLSLVEFGEPGINKPADQPEPGRRDAGGNLI